MPQKSCIFILLHLLFPSACGQLPDLRHRIIQQYNEQKSWSEVQSICRYKHTDLIIIRNEEENQALDGRQGWIGLYQDDNMSPWKWSSGDEIATFLNWDVGEPDLDQKCAYKAAITSSGRDDICEFRRFYICYGERLVLVKESKTWEEALEHCRSLHNINSFDLATLITPDDHDFA
ncbi:PREDICTED: secretory phospholipase A2 receptor-like [Poecilia mexicana]|nr:PREDICTED: secretory phospholipase A2 receptor-like [Poecilia mexicana]